MISCDLDTSVPDWIIEHHKMLEVFQELRIDYSCDGKSAAFACGPRGLDAAEVLAKLWHCLYDEMQTGRASFIEGD